MEKVFIGLAILLISATSFGGADPVGEQALDRLLGIDRVNYASDVEIEDPFTKLKNLYRAIDAEAPTIEELKPWMTGRCYSVDDKTKSLGSVMFIRASQDGGPLFPGLGGNKLYLRSGSSTSSSQFDKMSKDAVSTVEDSYNYSAAKLSKVHVTERSLSNTFYGETNPVVRNVRKVIRDGHTYYVSLLSVGIDTMYGGVHYSEGDLWWVCYHFAKVQFE